MKNPPSYPGTSRRAVIKFPAAAGVTAIGGYTLFEYAPWLNYDQQATQTRRPVEQNTTVFAGALWLCRCTTTFAPPTD